MMNDFKFELQIFCFPGSVYMLPCCRSIYIWTYFISCDQILQVVGVIRNIWDIREFNLNVDLGRYK